jgi:pilus assembly protein Flp/PilA
MDTRTELLTEMWQDEEGASAIEYGLLAALISVAIIVGAGILGVSLNETFCDVAGDLPAATTAC